MASADFPFALTKELSPGKVLILSLRAVRLYLARLRMDMGLRGGQHAYRPYAASLPVRVPTVEDLFPASFSFPSTVARRVGPCGSLRLPPSVPTGSFHPARISPCWAHWRTALPCRLAPPARGLGNRLAQGVGQWSRTQSCENPHLTPQTRSLRAGRAPACTGKGLLFCSSRAAHWPTFLLPAKTRTFDRVPKRLTRRRPHV